MKEIKKSRSSNQTPQIGEPPIPSIIGIGASAGGLQALEHFLARIDCLPGATFVIVQHLSPDQPSLLPELLQRITALPVHKIDHGVRPGPDAVYVVPPGFDVALQEGRFALTDPGESGMPHLPIDSFFRSLARDREAALVGVVLSGMGSDGTQGLKALREAGGVGFAQSPESAQFDSMPRSAIQAGQADVVAPASDLPALIADFLDHFQYSMRGSEITARAMKRRKDRPEAPTTEPPLVDIRSLETILSLLRSRTGHDFSDYKKSTLHRRIDRRMAIYHALTLRAYEEVLKENPTEVDLLFKEILIGVTSFFRDAPVWDHLQQVALPELLSTRPDRGPLRVWVPGCSTGEEVYSLAMVLTDALQALKPSARPAFKIFATDIDDDAIDLARAAKYPASITEQVSPERLARFFTQDESGYRVRKELREKVIFAVQNVALDPPFTRLDILVCRNLLIYFEAGLQRQLFPLFHYSISPGGLLLLGSAETVGPSAEYFLPLPGKFKIYRRLETFRSGSLVPFTPAALDRRTSPPKTEVVESPTPSDGARMHVVVENLLLQRYLPPAVLVTLDGDVLYVSGKTGRYLEPAAGRANWNVFAMAREGLSRLLQSAFREAVRDMEVVTRAGLLIEPPHGARHFRVTVDPVTLPGARVGTVLIVFFDAGPPLVSESGGEKAIHASDKALEAISRDSEVIRLREALRSALEDAQNTDEQLRAANEELQSTNEELQSTNEELTTSKEELQSMNEELQTVNQELQAKVDELSQASDDMRNLLNSTEIATVFLDESLRIRRFTAQCASLFKLIPGDLGRPITDITNDLKGWNVSSDSAEVLASLVPKEIETAARGNRWFRIRMMPYRTSNNHIDGLVITFADATRSKRLERELVHAKAVLEGQLGKRSTSAPVRKR